MKRHLIQRELQGLSIGHARVIAWEAVIRWSEDLFEIGTYNKPVNQRTLEGTLDKLCQMRNIQPESLGECYERNIARVILGSRS
jgi:hypothetical protein